MNKENKIMSDVFRYLTISIVFCFLGYGFGVLFVPETIALIMGGVLVFFALGLLLLAFLSRKNIIAERFSMNWVYLFTFVQGIILYPIIMMYIGNLSVEVVITVFIATVAIFTIMSIIAKREKSDKFLRLGKPLFYSLIILIILSIVNIFVLQTEIFVLGLSLIGVVIFTLYILYDISVIKKRIQLNEIHDEKDLSIHVLNLYLDFINIFLDLLSSADIFLD